MLSENLCPEVFKINTKAEVIELDDYSPFALQIMEAAESCPVGVIKYELEKT